MASSSLKRTKVFISYSHKDAKYLDQLKEHLAYLERNNLLEVWSDNNIAPGAQWREEIKRAIEYTAVAVLFISPSYLASIFIADNELPPLLHAAEKEGAIILPVIVRPSYFEDTELANFQAVNSPSMPIARMKGYERDAFWTRVVREIRRVVTPHQTPNTVIENQKVEADVLIQTTFQPNAPSSPPLEEQIAQWMQARGSNSTQTTKTYQFLITQFRSFLQKNGLDLNSEDMSILTVKSQEWAAHAVTKPAVKDKTYNHRLSTVSSFYSFALTQGWMKFNPIDEVQRREENTADGAKPLEVEKVKNALKSTDVLI